MANDRLRDALMAARVTHEDLAADLGVNTKTVERWITQARLPYPQFRHRISVLVPEGRDLAVAGWLLAQAARRDRPVGDRARLPLPGRRAARAVGQAVRERDREHRHPGLLRVLPARAARLARSSCSSRRPTTAPRSGSCSATRTARRSRSRGRRKTSATRSPPRSATCCSPTTCPYASHPGITIKLHATTLYNSIFWFDDDMLVNTHAYGVPAHFAPVLHLRHLSSGTLFQTYARSFDRVWDQTRKIWTGQKVTQRWVSGSTTSTTRTRRRPTASSRPPT